MFVSNFISSELILSASEINPKSEMKVQYFPYCDEWGYWTIDNVYKNLSDYIKLSSYFPATPAYTPENYNNWFHKQYILNAQIKNIFSLIYDFNIAFVDKGILINDYTAWANIFRFDYKSTEYKVPKRICYPHADAHYENNAVIFTTWLGEESNGGTAFWKYDGKYVAPIEGDPEYNYYMKNVIGDELVEFTNIEDNDKVQKVAQAPSDYGKVIVYTGAQYHSPVVDFNKKIRWSHLIAGHI